MEGCGKTSGSGWRLQARKVSTAKWLQREQLVKQPAEPGTGETQLQQDSPEALGREGMQLASGDEEELPNPRAHRAETRQVQWQSVWLLER